MELIDAILGRRSIRKYKEKDVEDEKIRKILEAAIWAPSSGNTQTWRFYIVRDERIKRELSASALNQRHIRESPVVIVVGYDMQEMYSAYRERGVTLYAIQDAAAATQNMLLRAYDLGLGTCWVGAFDENEVSRILDLPKYVRPVAIVTVGYP
ncbi:MAG TPA: nitroreductase family protein, partial [Archaeoglobaceae archaeon]|nr:nitroreductase family protein [Archaeoglobaceae archaeon]